MKTISSLLRPVLLLSLLAAGCSKTALVKLPVQVVKAVAYWSFDELSPDGASTPDATGNGHDARLNGQTLVEGLSRKAMKFEGFDQTALVGKLELTAPATVRFWMKTNDMFNERVIFAQTEGGEEQAGAIRIDAARIEVWDGDSWEAVIDRKMKIDEWMQIAVVYEASGKTSGYLNGERQHIVRCGFDFDGPRAAIAGSLPGGTGTPYTGLLDEFSIWGTAFTDGMIGDIVESDISAVSGR